MGRTVCVWFPDWPLICLKTDAPPSEPLIVVDDDVPARVVAVNRVAAALGVEVGSNRREAEARAPTASVAVRDGVGEARRFDEVVAAIEGVVPRVEIDRPGLLYVPVGGAVRYYGGEAAVVGAIVGAIVGVIDPVGARLGLADGPFAARAAAALASPGSPMVVSDTAAFLRDLDVKTLGPGGLIETFRWLGLATLGDLANLPREAIASRFGTEGLDAHRLASGEDRSANPRAIPLEMAVESEHHDEPLTMSDQVAFVIRGMAVAMLDSLRSEGIAPYRVAVEVESADGTVRTRLWRSTDPFTDHALSERVWWQLRAWMDTPGGVPGGVVRIRLDPSDLSDEGRQLPILEEVAGSWESVDEGRLDLDRALTRAQALVGPDAVLQAVPQGGRLPHERVRWHPWGEAPSGVERDSSAPWRGRTPGPSPALVSDRAPRIDIEWEGGMPIRIRLGTRWEPVLSWSGPWRLVGKWWRGEPSADRYQIVTSVGAVLCLVREGSGYLVGVYD